MLTLTQDALKLFWRTNKAMTLFMLASFIFLGISAVGMMFDAREVLGVNTWVKPLKFSISLILYAATMLWMFRYTKRLPRLKSFVLTASAFILFGEIVLIVLQAARAVPSHFNVSGSLNAAIWSTMGVLITGLYIVNLIGFALYLFSSHPDRTLAWSMKLGMLIMLVGFGVAFLMTSPTAAQLAHMQSGAPAAMVGAHTVGAADGGEGLPLVGWSTRYGDLRVAHFVGLHGLQALALFGFGLVLFARRANNRLTETHRLLLVAGAFIAYLGFVLLVTFQALNMEPVTSPSPLTLSISGLIAAAFVAYNALILWHAHRAPQAYPLSFKTKGEHHAAI